MVRADSPHLSSLTSLPAPAINDLFQGSLPRRTRLSFQRGSVNAFKLFDSGFLLFDSIFNLLELRVYSFRLFTKRRQPIVKRP